MKSAFLVVIGLLRSLADMISTLVRSRKAKKETNSHQEGGDNDDCKSDCLSSESGEREE